MYRRYLRSCDVIKVDSRGGFGIERVLGCVVDGGWKLRLRSWGSIGERARVLMSEDLRGCMLDGIEDSMVK